MTAAKITRRRFGRFAGGLLASSAVMAPHIARAAKVTLKFSIFAPQGNIATQVFQRWADSLHDKTSGDLDIQIFAASQMGPPSRQYDLVRLGVADLSWVLYGLVPGRFTLTEIASSPGLWKSALEGTKALSKVADDLNVEVPGTQTLSLVASASPKIMTNKEQIKSIADIKGKRLRHAGASFADAVAALGAVPVAVPPAEMSDALSKGVVDGVMTSYEAAMSFKLFDTVKYCTDIGLGTGTFGFLMNSDALAKLAPDMQKLIADTTGGALAEQLASEFDKTEEQSMQAIKDKISIIEVGAAQRAEFAVAYEKITKDRVADAVSRGLPADKLYARLRATG